MIELTVQIAKDLKSIKKISIKTMILTMNSYQAMKKEAILITILIRIYYHKIIKKEYYIKIEK